MRRTKEQIMKDHLTDLENRIAAIRAAVLAREDVPRYLPTYELESAAQSLETAEQLIREAPTPKQRRAIRETARELFWADNGRKTT